MTSGPRTVRAWALVRSALSDMEDVSSGEECDIGTVIDREEFSVFGGDVAQHFEGGDLGFG